MAFLRQTTISLILLLLLLGASPMSARATSVNLLTNGDFETGDFTGWENEGGMAIGAGEQRDGSYGANLSSLAHPRMNQVFVTNPGTTYYVAAHVRINAEPSAPAWGGLRVQVVDSTFVQLGSFGGIAASSSPIGTWTRIDFSFVATTVQSRIQFENFSGSGLFDASADDFIISDATIPADDAAPPLPFGDTQTLVYDQYFDGSQNGGVLATLPDGSNDESSSIYHVECTGQPVTAFINAPGRTATIDCGVLKPAQAVYVVEGFYLTMDNVMAGAAHVRIWKIGLADGCTSQRIDHGETYTLNLAQHQARLLTSVEGLINLTGDSAQGNYTGYVPQRYSAPYALPIQSASGAAVSFSFENKTSAAAPRVDRLIICPSTFVENNTGGSTATPTIAPIIITATPTSISGTGGGGASTNTPLPATVTPAPTATPALPPSGGVANGGEVTPFDPGSPPSGGAAAPAGDLGIAWACCVTTNGQQPTLHSLPEPEIGWLDLGSWFNWLGVQLWNRVALPVICYMLMAIQYVLNGTQTIIGLIYKVLNTLSQVVDWLLLPIKYMALRFWSSAEQIARIGWSIWLGIFALIGWASDGFDLLHVFFDVMRAMLGLGYDVLLQVIGLITYIIAMFVAIIPPIIGGVLNPTPSQQLVGMEQNIVFLMFRDALQGIVDSKLGWAYAAAVALFYVKFGMWFLGNLERVNE